MSTEELDEIMTEHADHNRWCELPPQGVSPEGMCQTYRLAKALMNTRAAAWDDGPEAGTPNPYERSETA